MYSHQEDLGLHETLAELESQILRLSHKSDGRGTYQSTLDLEFWRRPDTGLVQRLLYCAPAALHERPIAGGTTVVASHVASQKLALVVCAAQRLVVAPLSDPGRAVESEVETGE